MQVNLHRLIISDYVSTTSNIEKTFKWIEEEHGSDIKDRFFKYLVNLLNEHRDYKKEPLNLQNINWKEFNDEFKDFCKNYSPDSAQYFKEEKSKTRFVWQSVQRRSL